MMNYRREIDGLRAVAVLPVILFHAGFSWFSGGFVGVDVFFVISGYLITSILLAEHEAGRFSIVGFYERRARRILPALVLVMACCVPLAWALMLPYQLKDFAQSLVAVATFSSNVLFWRQSGYFDTEAASKPLLHTWSLAVEEQYYLLFPLALALCWRLGRRALVGLLALVTLACLMLAEWGWWNHPQANFFLTPTRAWELMIGSLIAFVPAVWLQGRSLWREALALAGLAAVLVTIVLFDDHTPHPSRYTLIPVLGTAAVILFAQSGTWAARLLSWPLWVGVGLISYSAYLWHQPLFAFARLKGWGEEGGWVLGGVSLLALALAYASWRWVEKPFRRPERFNRAQIFKLALGANLAVIGLGLLLVLDNGHVSRYPAADRDLVSLNAPGLRWYVNQRFYAMQLAPFEAGKTKVLIVGDSYAMDFTNASAENGYLSRASVSGLHIRTECGIVWTDDDVWSHLPSNQRESCRKRHPFDQADVQALLQQADVVVLAASWKLWEAQRLPATLDRLRALGVRQLVVVGRKNFGQVAPLDYLGWDAERKRAYRNPVTASHQAIRAQMLATLPPEVHVDSQQLLCADEVRCPVFTDELKLISFDGGHLTQEGARWMGQRLYTHPLLSPLR